MGSAEGAAKMVDKLNKFTASTPFRLQEVATSARQLALLSVSAWKTSTTDAYAWRHRCSIRQQYK